MAVGVLIRAVLLWLCATQVLAQPARARWWVEAPETLVLGQDVEAKVRFGAPSGRGARLYANVGSLGPPRAAGDGTFVAVYTPPADKYPQVAIIALSSEDGQDTAWVRIRLSGVAHVELHSEPHVEVSAQVGQASFGPVLTDRAGLASIPVIVPPGTSEAISVATDPLGNERRQAIPLNAPAFSRLLSVCPPSAGPEARAFWIFAVDERGEPAARLKLTASAQPGGVVTGIEARTPGMYRASFELSDTELAADVVTLSAAVAGEPGAAGSCEMPIPKLSLLQPPQPDPSAAELPTDAQAELPREKRWSVGVRAGWLTNLARVSGPTGVLGVGYRLPFASNQLRLSFELGYYQARDQSRSSDLRDDIGSAVRATPLLLRADWRFRVGMVELFPYLGAGMMAASSTFSATLIGEVQSWHATPLLAAGGGGAIDLGPGQLGLELSYWSARVNAATVQGNTGGLGVTLGYDLRL